MSMLMFDVVGLPAPQGSKRHVGNGVMVESSKKVQPWRDAVAWATREAILAGGPTFQSGPVGITVSFRLPMPRSRRRVDRDRGWRWADKRPDLDKLLRSTLDGLTAGGAFGDDCQVVRVTAEKIEVLEWTGASITISEAWGPA